MKILLTLLTLFLCSISFAQAEEFDYTSFERIPVLHEGRVKPLDSFARIQLKNIHGAESFNGMAASPWLARVLFDPAAAGEDPLFLIKNKNLKARLGLGEKENYFSLITLQPALQKTAPQIQKLLSMPRNELTPEQEDLLKLHKNAQQFMQLMRSFSLLLPLNTKAPKAYEDLFKDTQPNYITLSRIEKQLEEDLKNIITFKGDNLQYYTEDEQKIVALSFQLNVFRQAGATNTLLRIIPSDWQRQNAQWLSPWATILEGQGSPTSAQYLSQWENIIFSHRNENAKEWNAATKTAQENILKARADLSAWKLTLETYYNNYKPYQIALGFYALSIALIFIGFFAQKLPYIFAQFFLGGGALVHSAAIASRIYILDRPPVGTLYESILFVSLICVGTGIILSLLRRNNAALFSGAFAGLSMLLLAPYLKPEGESLEMLVAVLNTNFWLSTHVICITIGYAICAIAACLAHIYLFIRARDHTSAFLKILYKSLYHTSLVALLFTAVGTILGGIWADQSWGRFWGWDPKENGALLIVLWLIWLQHGRISGYLRPLAFALSIAALNIIVALSWFGVNLLNVGLHSYGFTTGLATALSLFCAAQSLLLAGLWTYIKFKERITA